MVAEMPDKEEKKTAESEAAEPETNSEEANPKKAFKKKLEKKDEEIASLKAQTEHWKNEYYRAYADTQNLRKTLEKDHQNAMKYRAEGFIDALLPVLDGFHMALSNEPKDPAIKNYLVGFQYVYKNFVAALENEGVSEIAPKAGDRFDGSVMNAVDSVEDDEPGKVVLVYGNGYKLYDRLIRPANVKVTVSRKPEAKEENKDASKENAEA